MSAEDGDERGDPSDGGQSEAEGSDTGYTSGQTELSIEDVRFLRAVRDINENPEEYPKTGEGIASATMSAVRETTTLSRSQVKYRMGAGSNKRGFEEMGFLVTHDPPMTDKGYGQRSAELTEKGKQRLEQGLRAYGLTEESGRADQEVVEQLENLGSQLESLERRLDTIERDVEEAVDTVEAMNERLDRYDERPMGAIDEQQAARLRTVIDAMPAFYQAFQMMGMDVREIQNADELSEAETENLIANVRETLNR